jgi:hypothetical protein
MGWRDWFQRGRARERLVADVIEALEGKNVILPIRQHMCVEPGQIVTMCLDNGPTTSFTADRTGTIVALRIADGGRVVGVVYEDDLKWRS